MESVKNPGVLTCVILLIGASVTGCATDQALPRPQPAPRVAEEPVQQEDRSTLGGIWVYEESGVVFPLVLDEKGNGTYQWKDGLFLTTSYESGAWQGTWHQPENDREGTFEVILSSDRSRGEGRWWYTRIEADHAPEAQGGSFTMTRGTEEDLAVAEGLDPWAP